MKKKSIYWNCTAENQLLLKRSYHMDKTLCHKYYYWAAVQKIKLLLEII